jgi:hypothetical protein
MITLPSVKTILKLSDEDMNEIYKEMKDIDIFSYPDNLFPNDYYIKLKKPIVSVTPYCSYKFEINYNGKTKKLLWDDEHQSQDIKATKLRNLVNNIQSIIEQKFEYKRLPKAEGAYQ